MSTGSYIFLNMHVHAFRIPCDYMYILHKVVQNEGKNGKVRKCLASSYYNIPAMSIVALSGNRWYSLSLGLTNYMLPLRRQRDSLDSQSTSRLRASLSPFFILSMILQIIFGNQGGEEQERLMSFCIFS